MHQYNVCKIKIKIKKMKQIQPVTVWSNGQELKADTLNSYVINDNLKSQAQFYYGIGVLSNTSTGLIMNTLSAGNLTMTGQDYADWQTNLYAWDWVASQLNLTIIGDVTTTTTTEAPITTTTTFVS